MLRLIKMWPKAPIEETDAGGHRRTSGGQKATRGTPQGRAGVAIVGEHLHASFHQGVSQIRSGPWYGAMARSRRHAVHLHLYHTVRLGVVPLETTPRRAAAHAST